MTADAAQILTLRPRLQLFGPLRLTHAGGDLPLPGRKARAILAYLALTPGRSASREQLADLLWTDRGPEQSRASLRQALKELRALAGASSAVLTTHAEVTLDGTALAVDLHEMRDAAAAHDLAALAALLEQTRGDVLEDLLDLAPAFDEWLQGERPRLRELVLADCVEAVEAHGASDMKNARRILRALGRLDPVNEAVARLAMRLDHAAGDGASLHRRYRQLSDLLESEFGAPPSEETRALFHALSARHKPAEADAAPAPPSERPATLSPVAHGGDMVPLLIIAPLQTAGADEAVGNLAEFCADDMRVALSRMRGIHVLAADDRDLGEIVRHSEDALGLYLLSGSLRRTDAKLRVNLQLANAASQIILWSDSLSFAEAGEAMIEAVVAKAAGAVTPAIDRDLEARLRQAASELNDERAIYTRARLLIRSREGLPTMREGVRLLEEMVVGNPRHLGARLLLARAYNTDFMQQVAGHDVVDFRERADRHLQAATGIEPGHYGVRIARAWRHLRKGEAAAAQREFEGLLANLPHDADVTNGCAMGLCYLGLFDQAETLMQRAFSLNPFPPSDYHADLAIVLSLKGECEEAEEHFAVSGETGLMYTAVRIANAARLTDGAERIGPALPRFVEGFRQAWQPARAATVDDAIEWTAYTLALIPAEPMARVREGLRGMLAPGW